MEPYKKLSRDTVSMIFRHAATAIRASVSDCPVAMGILVTKITYQLSEGVLKGVTDVPYIKNHVQETIMTLITKQHIWATIMTVGERCDIYLTAPQSYKQLTYRYEV